MDFLEARKREESRLTYILLRPIFIMNYIYYDLYVIMTYSLIMTYIIRFWSVWSHAFSNNAKYHFQYFPHIAITKMINDWLISSRNFLRLLKCIQLCLVSDRSCREKVWAKSTDYNLSPDWHKVQFGCHHPSPRSHCRTLA